MLDPGVQADMRLCANARAAGRKATVAKDYAKADEEFARCLAVASWDPQALSERGYARLQAGRLDEAEADLKQASVYAPSKSTLAQQILHNRVLTARKRNDEQSAKSFESDEKSLKDRRRRPANLACSQEVSTTQLKPEHPASVQEAIRVMREATAKAADMSPNEVEFRRVGADDAKDTDLIEEAAKAGGTLPDSAQPLTTEVGATMMNHILISKDGKLYLFPNMSTGRAYRCGSEGLADLTVAGGGHQPWHIVRNVTASMPGEKCDASGNNCYSYCPWDSSDIELIILDARTLEGVSAFQFSFHAEDATQPDGLLDFEWKPTRFAVKGCGAPAEYSYLGDP